MYDYYEMIRQQQTTNQKLDTIIEQLDDLNVSIISGDSDIVSAVNLNSVNLLACLLLLVTVCIAGLILPERRR